MRATLAGTNAFFPMVPATLTTPSWRAHIIMTWWKRIAGSLTTTDRAVVPPGRRTSTDDFVALGLRLRPEHRAMARQAWRAFVEEAGDYPATAFDGKGIAILSGSMPYLVPSLIALKSLRRVGCQLPVELWFPSSEAPPAGVSFKLKRLGATARKFPLPEVLGKVCP